MLWDPVAACGARSLARGHHQPSMFLGRRQGVGGRPVCGTASREDLGWSFQPLGLLEVVRADYSHLLRTVLYA